MNQKKIAHKALVIDDNKQTADSLCDMLGLLDFHADAVYGSRDALYYLKSTSPNLVFLDINMPGLSGFEILSFIQREPLIDNMTVIVITSDDQEETAKRAMDAGAESVIVKPVTLQALEEVLARNEVRK
jgi:CheY-like chemotaxis protein